MVSMYCGGRFEPGTQGLMIIWREGSSDGDTKRWNHLTRCLLPRTLTEEEEEEEEKERKGQE